MTQKLEDLLPRSRAVQFVRVPETEPVAAETDTKPKTISLKQGQSVVLVGGAVSVKVSNTKFHSLLKTSYVLVNFLTRIQDGDSKDEDEERQDAHHVEPALVGSAIACNGQTLAVVDEVQSGSKLLKLKLAAGVTVRKDFAG